MKGDGNKGTLKSSDM